jgi:hypothetical protein
VQSLVVGIPVAAYIRGTYIWNGLSVSEYGGYMHSGAYTRGEGCYIFGGLQYSFVFPA